MPHLQLLDGDRPLFVYSLRPGRTVVGRSDRCDLALPFDNISRVHCLVEQRADGWWLVDRSRHGTLVNGTRAGRHRLTHDDRVSVGPFTMRFSTEADTSLSTPTATRPVPRALHEQLVEGDETGLASSRVELHLVRGPHQGRVVQVSRSVIGLGGPGADVVLDEGLPADAARIRVVRGRAMIEPGAVVVHLAGSRVRALTPIYPGEEVRLGAHAVVVEVRTTRESAEAESFGDMVGSTRAMRHLFGSLGRMAAYDEPVLLCGPSGTGKELAARGLHEASCRYEGPLVAVNCAGIPDTLFESELFGHEKGAFTGAATRQDGAFQRADGGTLFLDEVGELSQEGQAKLLRALESHEVRRVGGAHAEYPDLRLISATNRDLPAMVDEGLFRRDLYFRIAVLVARLPALSERRKDIPLLARTLLSRSHPEARMTEEALEALGKYDWPGNIRELRNVLTRAVVLGGPLITRASLTFNPWSFDGEAPVVPLSRPDDPEVAALVDALRDHGGNRTKTARALGIPRSSLLYKLKKHGLLEGKGAACPLPSDVWPARSPTARRRVSRLPGTARWRPGGRGRDALIAGQEGAHRGSDARVVHRSAPLRRTKGRSREVEGAMTWTSTSSSRPTGVTCPSCRRGQLHSRFSCLQTLFSCGACGQTYPLADLAPALSDEDFDRLSSAVDGRLSDRVW